jgi:hypothetical protein
LFGGEGVFVAADCDIRWEGPSAPSAICCHKPSADIFNANRR